MKNDATIIRLKKIYISDYDVDFAIAERRVWLILWSAVGHFLFPLSTLGFQRQPFLENLLTLK